MFAVPLVAMLVAAQGQPAAGHPPVINMPAEVAARLYAAIDADGVKTSAIQVATWEPFAIGPRTSMILVFGVPKKSSSSVCRGPVFAYEEDQRTKTWTHKQLGTYALAPAADCNAPPKSASRLAIDEAVKDGDITGIIGAIRSVRVVGDDKGRKPQLPSFTKKASITAIRVRGEEAMAAISIVPGEEHTLLLTRFESGWFIFAAGDGLALPEP